MRLGSRPDGFGYNLLGCTVDFRFPTTRLLEFSGKEPELEVSANPFAVVVLAFLKARQTVDDLAQQRFWKLRLIRGLYERGLERKDVQQLFRLIHFFMILPAEAENEVWQSVQAIEQEKQMPYLTPLEQIWLAKGEAQGEARGEAKGRASLEAGIEKSLQVKFGLEAATSLMPDVRSMALAQLYDVLS